MSDTIAIDNKKYRQSYINHRENYVLHITGENVVVTVHALNDGVTLLAFNSSEPFIVDVHDEHDIFKVRCYSY